RDRYVASIKRLWPLREQEFKKLFGTKVEADKKQLVVPVFAPTGVMVSGVRYEDASKNKSHVDFHLIGDLGAVEVYYFVDGKSVSNCFIYHRLDKDFVSLTSSNEYSKRLAWDKAKFEKLMEWIEKK